MRLSRFFCEFALHAAVLSLLSAAAPAGEPSSAMADPKADPARGQRLYQSRCIACHSLESNRVGPMHRGVYGRRAGSVEGYAYSRALKKSTVIWNDDTLDAWLRDPESAIAGQRMNFRVKKPQDRRDLISYLKQESQG